MVNVVGPRGALAGNLGVARGRLADHGSCRCARRGPPHREQRSRGVPRSCPPGPRARERCCSVSTGCCAVGSFTGSNDWPHWPGRFGRSRACAGSCSSSCCAARCWPVRCRCTSPRSRCSRCGRRTSCTPGSVCHCSAAGRCAPATARAGRCTTWGRRSPVCAPSPTSTPFAAPIVNLPSSQYGASLVFAIVGLSVVLVLRGLSDRVTHTLGVLPQPALVAMLTVSLWMLALSLDVLRVLARRVTFRRAPRVGAALSATLGERAVSIIDLTSLGAGVLSHTGLEVGERLVLESAVPTETGVTSMRVPVVVRNVRYLNSGDWRIGLEFGELDDATANALAEFCTIEPMWECMGSMPSTSLIEAQAGVDRSRGRARGGCRSNGDATRVVAGTRRCDRQRAPGTGGGVTGAATAGGASCSKQATTLPVWPARWSPPCVPPIMDSTRSGAPPMTCSSPRSPRSPTMPVELDRPHGRSVLDVRRSSAGSAPPRRARTRPGIDLGDLAPLAHLRGADERDRIRHHRRDGSGGG